MITDQFYKKIRFRMRFALRPYGLSYLFEDFTHDYFVKVLEGRCKHQTINQFVIDNLRRITKSRSRQGKEMIRQLYE